MKTYAQLRNALEDYLSHHLADLDTPERVDALFTYCQGLSLEYPRKTLASMAQRLEPHNHEGCRQRMHRAVHRGRFSKNDVFARLQQTIWERMEQDSAFCIDDTGFEKKGEASACVQRQYSGTLGKVGNCQVAVSLHVASRQRGMCVDAQLYLPEVWANDAQRRARAGIPAEIVFQTKADIALDMLERALQRGAPSLPVLADAGYGDSRDFRDRVRKLGLHFAVGVSSQTTVWPADVCLQSPAATGRPGRPAGRLVASDGSRPASIVTLAQRAWDADKFQSVTWRRGTKGPMRGHFYAARVQSAERHTKGAPPSEKMWLLVERDIHQKTGFKYYFCSLPASASCRALVRLCKLRWRIERDYQDMKQQLGLDRYEGRTWGGFHRHFAMVALMHAFLSLYKEAFSPSGRFSMDSASLSSCHDLCTGQLAAPVPNMFAGF